MREKLRAKQMFIITEQIRANFPFPERTQEPTKLALILQERIKYMFGITVEPIVIRQPGSYYKTIAFRHLWEMRTICNSYGIACYEQAGVMAKKSAWHVLDSPLFEHPDSEIIIKFIY